MFFVDHPPPHFHALYGEYEAIVEIATSEIIGGNLPLGARSLVKQWADLHREDLVVQWDLARRAQPLGKIDPLP